jgi:uncharacterized membrane protein
MLHQFFDLSELASTVVTLVPFKHNDDLPFFLLPLAVTIIVVIVVIVVVPSIPALSAEVAVYLPSRLRMVVEHA